MKEINVLPPNLSFLERLRIKWGEYNNFTFREIISLVKAKLKGQITLHCAYSMVAQKLVKSPIKTVIDIGANNGEYTRSAKYILTNAKIYAFEPTELCKQIKGKDIEAFQIALWNKNNKGVFYEAIKADTNIPSSGSSFFKNEIMEKNTEKQNEKLRKVIIDRKRFDKLNISIERPCFVKIDVEGAELEVLKGFGNKLKEVDVIQVEYIFEELYERHNLDKIVQLLNKYNFRLFQPMVTWYKNRPLSNDLIFFRIID